MKKDWMASCTVNFCPKVMFKDGEFMFTEKEAREFIENLRRQNPNHEFHLSKNGKIIKEGEHGS